MLSFRDMSTLLTLKCWLIAHFICLRYLERELMGKVARMKLQYFGHVTRWSAGNLALTVLESSVDGLCHQGRPKRQWMDDIEQWSGCSYIQLKEMSQNRDQWRRKTIEWSSAVANHHQRWSTSEWVSDLNIGAMHCLCLLICWYLYVVLRIKTWRNDVWHLPSAANIWNSLEVRWVY